MKKKNDRWEKFLKEVEDDYGPEVAEECRKRLFALAKDERAEPYRILKEVRWKLLKKFHDSVVKHGELHCNS